MSEKMVLLTLGALGAWGLLAFIFWAIVHVGSRDDPPEWDDYE